MLLIRRGTRAWLLSAAAVVAMAAGSLFGLTARAAGPSLPPLPSLPLPTLPTPSLPSLPLPSLSPLPSLPLPLPSAPVTVPASAGTSAGLPTVPGGLLPGIGPGSSSSGTAAGTGTAAGEQVQTSVLGALLGLLGTPAGVGVEQPTLRHFTLDGTLTSGRLTPVTAAEPSPTRAAPGVLWGVLVVCVAVMLLVGAGGRHRPRVSRLRVLAVSPMLLLAGLLTGAASGAMFTATPTATTSPVPQSSAATAPARVVHAASTGGALLQQVAVFESAIAREETVLQSPPAGPGVSVLGEDRRLATVLEATLQQEYAFFDAIARDPAQSTALLQAAATGPATVRDAVTYNVDALRAQLAQEEAITQAAQRTSTASVALPAAPAAAGTPPLAWPMAGVITQGFGPSVVAVEPAVTVAGITYPHFHTGIDIASMFGTPVHAAGNGVVALAGAETDGAGHLVGYGNYVVIAHGSGLMTLYGHLEQVLVQPGQAVHVGDPIGLEGSTGNSTGPHVHFELRVNGTPTDPIGYVQPR